jgi:cytochrome c oxidase subunit 1
VLIAVFNFAYSLKRGPVASRNPWRSRSPEFMIPSPIPLHNYPQPFEVVGEPYDYGKPGAYVSIDPDRAPAPIEEEAPSSGAEAAAAGAAD